MKREIKFRAWDGKKMEYNPVQCTDGPEITRINSNIEAMFKEWHTPQYEALMQYTGLKDKNGKEIYEGDIIYRKTRLFSDSPWKKERYVIRFDEKEGAFLAGGITGLRHYFEIRDPFEVIGNIYENPELLKTLNQ